MPKMRLTASAFNVKEPGTDNTGEFPPAPPPSGDETVGTVSIISNRTTDVDGRPYGASPAGFYFSIAYDGWVLPGQYALAYPESAFYHELRHEWDFGDPDQIFTTLDRELPWDRVFDVDGERVHWNQPGEPSGGSVTFLGHNANKGYGPHISQVYFVSPEEFDGADYVVKTVTVKVQTKAMALAGTPPVIATKEIRIDNPDVVFPLSSTVYIDPDGDFSGVPSDALTATTFSGAILAVRDTLRPRLRFRSGKTVALDLGSLGSYADGGWRNPSEYEHQMADIFGDLTGFAILDTTQNLGALSLRAERNADSSTCMAGLHLLGSYDSTQPWLDTFQANSGNGFPGIDPGRSHWKTVWRCISEKHRVGIAGGTNCVMGDVYVSSWYDYGQYTGVNQHNMGFRGCSFKQALGTISRSGNPTRYSSYFAPHGPSRMSGSDGEVSWSLCDARSLNSHGAGMFQPCFRTGGNGFVDSPLQSKISLERIVAENNGGLGTGAFKGPVYPKMWRAQKVYITFAATAHGGALILQGASNTTVENAILEIGEHVDVDSDGGNVTMYSNKLPRNAEMTEDPSLYDHPFRIKGISLIDRRGVARFGSGSLQETKFMSPGWYVGEYRLPASGWETAAILMHTPNRPGTSDYYDAGPITEQQSHVLQTTGYREDDNGSQATSNEQVPLDTGWAYAHDASVWAPQPGSLHYQAAGEDAPIDDFYGNIRGSNASDGAVEPSSLI